MRLSSCIVLLSAACALVNAPVRSFGQDRANGQDLSRVAVGGKISTLGIGIEGAVAVTDHSNVRGSFNILDYSRPGNKDGISYDAHLDLRSIQITYDQYLGGVFHISPGLLAYNGNRLHGNASAPPGQTFSLGGVRYFSSQTNPVSGTASTDLRKAAPVILFGFGNMLRKSPRHFAVNAEAGIVFQGPPNTTLNLAGEACVISPTAGCLNAATNSIVQTNIQAQERRIDDDLTVFKYYPVLSFGVSWKF